MKIYVFSDTHRHHSAMEREVIDNPPDAIIHLGDYFDDGQAIGEEYPNISLLQVPGNCDRYRCPPNQPEILIPRIGGVDLYMTHGHHLSPK